MMQWMGLNEIREKYLSFFESKEHLRMASAPLVPQGDKSLLLINSGMAPLKPYFTGKVTPPSLRVTTCQKCIRTPDIERVGKTARHGTFFEMLGNFSFGDYFKREATAWAWEFCTQVMELPAERLYVSIYENDDEAYDIWTKEVGVSPDHMVRLGKEDNFWEIGSGPCGPCSEIYFDRGPAWGCGKPDCAVGCDCDRYIEFWNLVFTQFDGDGAGNYTPLEHPNIDTGMGLERMACIMQDVANLFEVDTVMAITKKVSEIVGATYREDERSDVSLRVITDHIRSTTMMVADGVMPSNEGRGYVLRRLLRRAARHGKLLGVDHPFLCDVVETVIHENEGHYPDLRERAAYITRVVRVEEENFARTIDGGMRIFSEMLAQHKENNESVFSGADAFKLYDTYGFPIDLTVEMAREEGMEVDLEAFRKLMQEQKVRAREARKALGDLGWAGIDFGQDIPETQFVGYDKNETEGTVLAIVAEDESRSEIAAGVEAIVVLDRTTMYAEMGGQVADHGTITGPDGVFEVTDVQKNKGGKFMHYGRVVSGTIKLGEACKIMIDPERRAAIRRAHTATHLLQAALLRVLGEHCHQAGSLVEPDHLRFDFTHFSAVTPEELVEIGNQVSEMVLRGEPVETMVLPIAEAQKLGATALFGEKYGETVRVVKMGEDSLEFCGGTHLDNTAKVGPFRILSEASVASGVRRIEAYTGKEVLRQTEQMSRLLLDIAHELKTTPKELMQRAHAMVSEVKELKQRLDAMKDKLFSGEIDRCLFAAREVGGLKVLTVMRNDIAPNDLRKMGDQIRDREPDAVAVLASTQGEKITLLAVCGKNAVGRGIKAGQLIKEVSAACGGSGGGKPDSAMGGGRDLLKLDDALAGVDDFVTTHLA